NYIGILRISRIGNVWQPYWAVIRQDGTHANIKSSINYIDVEEKYVMPISQIQVAMRKYPDSTAVNQRVNDIKVFKINRQPDAIPYILDVGDKVTLDGVNNDIYLNGEPRNDLKNFGGSFFTLKKGLN